MDKERKFPLLGEGSRVGSIPWWVAEQAYIVYASKYGDSQSLERLAERGGFGIEEMDLFYPEWRDKTSLIVQLQAENERLREALEAIRVIPRKRERYADLMHQILDRAEQALKPEAERTADA